MYFPAWFQESDLNYLDKLKKGTEVATLPARDVAGLETN